MSNPTSDNIKTVNLYGEPDGISILVDNYGDIISDPDEIKDFGGSLTRVIGHALYTCPLDEAQAKIRDAYMAR